VQHPAAGCICADKKNGEDSGLPHGYLRSMRRGFAILIALVVLGPAAATAVASFHAGTYGGEASGERVLFTTDTRTAHGFTWGDRSLFDNAAIEHHDGVWRFHTHSTRWQVHGHWVQPNQVQGSVCALDSGGNCPAEQLHHYTAHLKTAK
jgi:hypothetical protein